MKKQEHGREQELLQCLCSCFKKLSKYSIPMDENIMFETV